MPSGDLWGSTPRRPGPRLGLQASLLIHLMCVGRAGPGPGPHRGPSLCGSVAQWTSSAPAPALRLAAWSCSGCVKVCRRPGSSARGLTCTCFALAFSPRQLVALGACSSAAHCNKKALHEDPTCKQGFGPALPWAKNVWKSSISLRA
eukprot:7967525-Pyramimonas_sp.AAC.1